jgi:hypothetical protein
LQQVARRVADGAPRRPPASRTSASLQLRH